MPTGYTARLEKDWNVARWLKQDVVRALGVCVTIRDEGDLTADQILKALEPQKESYESKGLREAEEQLRKALAKSKKTWKEERAKAIENAEEQWALNKREVAAKTIEYRAAVRKVQEFQAKATTEAGKCVAKFALQQLEMVQGEFEPLQYYEDHVAELKATTVETYAATEINGCRVALEYAKEALESNNKREKERYEFYKALIDDCDRCLK